MTAPIRAGDLKRYITIQQRSTTQDSTGGQSLTWTNVKSVYAKIEPLTGRELLAAQQIAAQVSHRLTVRYDPIFADPKTAVAYRVLYNNRIFDVQASMNFEEEDAFVELLAVEGVSQG